MNGCLWLRIRSLKPSSVARPTGTHDIKHGYVVQWGMILDNLLLLLQIIFHSSSPSYVPWGLTSVNYIVYAPLMSGFLLGLTNGEHWQEIRQWKRKKLGYLFFISTPCPLTVVLTVTSLCPLAPISWLQLSLAFSNSPFLQAFRIMASDFCWILGRIHLWFVPLIVTSIL